MISMDVPKPRSRGEKNPYLANILATGEILRGQEFLLVSTEGEIKTLSSNATFH